MRVIVLEFLDTDVYHVSNENCAAFIDPLVESWDVDLESFRLDIRMNPGLVAEPLRTFAFVESAPSHRPDEEPGFRDFLDDPRLSRDLTDEEARILERHAFSSSRPNKIYYYRALQLLRDPLHFDGD
jgi:hypothetical protein